MASSSPVGARRARRLRRRLPGGGDIALFALVAAALVSLPLILIIGAHANGTAAAGGLEGLSSPSDTSRSAGSGLAQLNPISSGPSAAMASASPAAGQVRPPDPGADPSGEPMPVGDLPGWRQVFADNFSSPVPLGKFPQAVLSNWWDYHDENDTSGHGTYSPSQVVSISGGVMNLYLHTAGGRALVAAPLARLHGPGGEGGMLYGRFAVRFRADAVPGYKTAWLLWPDSENWSDGEIDFPEADLTGNISASMHYRGNPHSWDLYHTKTTYTYWHTAVIEWTAQSVTFILDGQVIGRSTDASLVPQSPMHWVLQTETSLNAPAPDPSAAGNVQVDWVTAYAEA